MYGPYLYHHGVKGQKWGLRRYQKSDGTLTRAGKRKLKKGRREIAIGEDKKYVHDAMKKYPEVKIKEIKKSSSAHHTANKNASTTHHTKNDKTTHHTKTQAPTNKITKKDIKHMTDKELNARINRLRNEQTYADLLAKDSPKKNAGKAFVNEVIYDASKDVAKQVAKYALGTAVNKAVGKNIVNVKSKKNKD